MQYFSVLIPEAKFQHKRATLFNLLLHFRYDKNKKNMGYCFVLIVLFGVNEKVNLFKSIDMGFMLVLRQIEQRVEIMKIYKRLVKI